MPDPTPQQLAEIEAAIHSGNKIEAIKLYRQATGLGLKQSKEWVESQERKLRSVSPEKFSLPAKSGCLGLIAFTFITGSLLLHHIF